MTTAKCGKWNDQISSSIATPTTVHAEMVVAPAETDARTMRCRSVSAVGGCAAAVATPSIRHYFSPLTTLPGAGAGSAIPEFSLLSSMGIFEMRSGIRITIDGALAMNYGLQIELNGDAGVIKLVRDINQVRIWTPDEYENFSSMR